jgi:NTE family protein
MNSEMRSRETWLCLSGGNALGAYHAGVYASLHDAGIRPVRIGGASIGAIVGAVIAGNAPEQRVAQLNLFWQSATEMQLLPAWLQPNYGKVTSALGTLIHGRPGLFHPSIFQWWKRLWGLSSPSLFERSPLRQALPQFIDFDRLNGGEVRLLLNAVDVESGEDVIFDTARERITIDHLMATTAFPVLYPPEKIAGRMYVDGGLSENLPLSALFEPPETADVICLAVDLASPRGAAPKSLDDALNRGQDLILSKQSEHAIGLVRHKLLERRAASADSPENYSTALLHVAYDNAGEIGGKILEFSPESIASRMEAGKRDGRLAADWLIGQINAPGTFTLEHAWGGSLRDPSAGRNARHGWLE